MVGVPSELASDYAACERLARAHYENFPVASLLLPADMRPHVAALYAFARAADDIADEGDRRPEEREALLNALGAALDGTRGQVPSPALDWKNGPDPFFFLRALAHTIDSRNLPVQLFHDLLSAFRQDVRVKRYRTWTEVLDYCSRSANPVGRLVLRIAGRHDAALDRESDALCTALQLTNFWQDLAIDWRRGRLYVPLEDVEACGADERDLDERRITPAWRDALARAGQRTRALFDEGRAIGGRVGGRLGWELRLTWLGGLRVLTRLERRGFDVFDGRPALSAGDVPWIAWRAIAWKG
jgi:squalene synthase HpnC